MKYKLIIFCPWGEAKTSTTLSSMPMYLIEELELRYDIIIIDKLNLKNFKLSKAEIFIINFTRYISFRIQKLLGQNKFEFGGVSMHWCYQVSKILDKVSLKYSGIPILTFGPSATRFYRGRSPVFQFIDGIYSYKIDYYIERNKLTKWEKYNIHKTDFSSLKNSKAIFCTSETIAEAVKKYSKSCNLSNVIMNVGTGGNIPKNFKEYLKRNDNKNIYSVCFIFSDFIRKNGLLVLDVAKLLKNENFIFHFLGKKPIDVNEEEWPNILFHGYINKDYDIHNYLKIINQCDINIMPTKGDLTPHVICECNAFGVPTIANDVGGIKDLIGSGGVLLKTNSPLVYANELRNIVLNIRERSLQSQKIYETEQRWAVVADKISLLINEKIDRTNS